MARFGSPREALRVYFAARRGPRPARPRWDGMPRTGSYRPPDEVEVSRDGQRVQVTPWVEVGRILRAECGVEPGSPEETALRRWVEGTGERTWGVRRVLEKMAPKLCEVGLMRPQKVVRDEVDGTPWSRLMDAVLLGGGRSGG